MIHSVLSPGVIIEENVTVEESILLTDAYLESGSTIVRSVLDKRARVGKNVTIGGQTGVELQVAMVGKNSIVPEGVSIKPGGIVGTDVSPEDYSGSVVESGVYIQTRRLPNEV